MILIIIVHVFLQDLLIQIPQKIEGLEKQMERTERLLDKLCELLKPSSTPMVNYNHKSIIFIIIITFYICSSSGCKTGTQP